MYSLIVIEDEAIIRKGICDFIDWAAMGFSLAGEFEDGKDALEFLKENRADVILTDVKMSVVSGLEIARHAHENLCGTHVVILSGYKEFEYARQAMEYGVEHYLLKPIRVGEIAAVFEKVRHKLDGAADAMRQQHKDERRLSELLPLFQEQFFVGLASGSFRDEAEIQKRMGMLDIGISPERPCALFQIRFAGVGSASQTDAEKSGNIIPNVFREERDGIRFFPIRLTARETQVLAVDSCPERGGFQSRADAQMQELRGLVGSILSLDMECRLLKSCPSIYALAADEGRMFRPHGGDEQEGFRLAQGDYGKLAQQHRLLLAAVCDGNMDEAEALADGICRSCSELPLAFAQKIAISLFSMLAERLTLPGMDSWLYLKESVDYKRLLDCASHSELAAYCKEVLRGMFSSSKRHAGGSRLLVEQALKYMEAHYSEELSVQEISDRLFLTPAYFSRLFKQHMGATYTDCLIKIRMENAVRLLSLGKYKVYEVSEMVGYRSEKYFFRIFRRHTGFAPAEYVRWLALSEMGRQGGGR
jgi:two-component system response regulator YesN